MKKEHQLKKEHHYVWAKYLRNWSVDGKRVWFRTAKGKLICESTRLVAKERYFYQVKPLDQNHVHIIGLFTSGSGLREMHEKFLGDFLKIQHAEIALKRMDLPDKDELTKDISALKHNSIENIHTGYESGASEIIDSLLLRDLSILENQDKLILFCEYIGQQFARTKSFKDLALLAMSKSHAGEDKPKAEWIHRTATECWWLLSHMIGSNFGSSIYCDKANYNQCILINKTGTPFITSDQPVINVHPELTGEIDNPPEHHQLDLFYPISPDVAFMMCSSSCYPHGTSELNVKQVEKLNIKVAQGAYFHIFGDDKSAIAPYVKYVGNQYASVKQFIKDV